MLGSSRLCAHSVTERRQGRGGGGGGGEGDGEEMDWFGCAGKEQSE
jgi:hypothetical protein